MRELRIILASASPRRAEILAGIVKDFDIIPSDIRETFDTLLDTTDNAMNNAMNKAMDIALRNPDALVIGADTIVSLGDLRMGKPSDRPDAVRTLKMLSGKTHIVITGVAMVHLASDIRLKDFDCSQVTFRELDMKDIERYADEKKPFDKAGAYGIQEIGEAFVQNLEGSFTNVVGLPAELVASMLEDVLRRIDRT